MSKKRIKELERDIVLWRESYHAKDKKTLVSDEDYDTAEDELRSLDPTNSILEKVGAEPTSENKRTHKIAMGSQAKIKINETVVDGIDDICQKFLQNGETIVSYKMDGISAAIDYSGGELMFATTRGNGFVGDDIPNPSEFNHVPLTVRDDCDFTARCELVITYADFEIINAQLSDDDKFSNPRNAVAGIAQKADSPFRKYITAYYYDAVGDFVADYKEFVFGFLVDVFCLDDNGDICADAVVPYHMNMTDDEFRELAEDLDKTRKDLPYMIDGLIIEFNSLEKMEKLGVATGNKPKGSIALKFNPVAEPTTVWRVVGQVGSTGDLTPVIEFEPVLIDGSIVRRASLHNYSIFKDWGFCVGDKILVQKNNDIIPQVKEIVERCGGEICVAPTHCPVCDSKLSYITVAKTENLTCTHPKCPAKYVGIIKKWATKSGMASKGVGDAFFDAYVGWAGKYDVVNPSGLYDLTVDGIMALSDRYKEKSATNIYNAIQSSKTMILMDFFGGLNIYGAGSRTFKKIIDFAGLKTVDETVEFIQTSELFRINGIGDITSTNIKDGVDALSTTIGFLNGIITIEAEVEVSADAQAYLFTGTFVTIDPDTGKGYKRKALEALVSSKGHTPATSVNKQLNYLVTSDPESTKGKMKKARDMGIPIIGEDEFFAMMEE